MKICFIASIQGKIGRENDYKNIVNIIKKKGYNVFADHVLKQTQEDLNSLTQEEKVKFHKKIIDLIKKSDIIVSEISYSSLSVGYLISLALDFGKPTILLYKGNKEPNILSTLEQSDRLIVSRYQSLWELEKIINTTIEEAKEQMDTRFNFFISPQIASYLDWVTKTKKVPRAVYLRNLIEEDMKKNKKFNS